MFINGLKDVGSASVELHERPGGGALKKSEDARGGLLKEPEEVKKDLTPQRIDTIATDMQARLKRLNTELRLEVDQKSDRVIVKILDQGTKQVIRQIPSEELLAISERLEEFVGVFYDSRS